MFVYSLYSSEISLFFTLHYFLLALPSNGSSSMYFPFYAIFMRKYFYIFHPTRLWIFTTFFFFIPLTLKIHWRMRTRSYFIPSVGSLLQTLCQTRPLAPRTTIEIANKSIKVVKSYVGRRLAKNTLVFWYTCTIVWSTTCHSVTAAQLAFIQRYGCCWLFAVIVPVLSYFHSHIRARVWVL